MDVNLGPCCGTYSTISFCLQVFEDGALFFSKVDLHHIGNYTCMDAEDPTISQIHKLRVQSEFLKKFFLCHIIS